MHIDASDFQTLELGGAGVNFACPADWDAELVLGFTRSNLVMRLGVNIRVDPYRNIRGSALCCRNLRQQFELPTDWSMPLPAYEQIELRFGFDVNAQNSFIDCECKLGRSLANT